MLASGSKDEAFARRSVELREGPDHPAVAADRAALAALLDGQGKLAEAEALYQRALAVFERVYGRGHYEVAVTLNNLAVCCDRQARSREAARLYRRALGIFETALGRGHGHAKVCRENLARALRAARRRR